MAWSSLPGGERWQRLGLAALAASTCLLRARARSLYTRWQGQLLGLCHAALFVFELRKPPGEAALGWSPERVNVPVRSVLTVLQQAASAAAHPAAAEPGSHLRCAVQEWRQRWIWTHCLATWDASPIS